jgi:ferritin-like metal-binding protein YciE
MQGLVKEEIEMIVEDASKAVKDAGLSAAAQRIEHYEMASYRCVRTYAKIFGYHDDASQLQNILNQEGDDGKNLAKIAEKLNIEVQFVEVN